MGAPRPGRSEHHSLSKVAFPHVEVTMIPESSQLDTNKPDILSRVRKEEPESALLVAIARIGYFQTYDSEDRKKPHILVQPESQLSGRRMGMAKTPPVRRRVKRRREQQEWKKIVKRRYGAINP